MTVSVLKVDNDIILGWDAERILKNKDIANNFQDYFQNTVDII